MAVITEHDALHSVLGAIEPFSARFGVAASLNVLARALGTMTVLCSMDGMSDDEIRASMTAGINAGNLEAAKIALGGDN